MACGRKLIVNACVHRRVLPKVAAPGHRVGARGDAAPSFRDQPEVAASELERPSAAGKIHWYPRECRAPDLQARPSLLIVKPGKNLLVCDWPNPAYGLNGFPINTPVVYGDMDGFLRMLTREAHMAGLDFRDCFLHWLADFARA